MSKNAKKAISVLLIVTFLLSFGALCFASEPEEAENESGGSRFTTISSANAQISKSGLTVTCNATLKAKYSTSLKITMVLQKNSSGSWSDVKTWTKTGSGTSLSAEESRVINILYTYRLKVTFKADSETYTTYAYY